MKHQKDFSDGYSIIPATQPTKTGSSFYKSAILALCAVISVLVLVLVPSSLLWGDMGAIGRALTLYTWNPGENEYRINNVLSINEEFDWKKVTPTPYLNWVQCYPNSQCARLEVPLDYSDPNGGKAAIALVRIKAKVSSGSEEYRGPILFNPGGPGGSGITLIKALGTMFQQMLGKEYDIIGFDPRGIGETTPPVSIFSDDAERANWFAGTPPLLNSTPDSLPQAFARAQVFSQLVDSRSKLAAQHVSTAVVARDMLSIVKAHGRDRLQYWGFSYGSVLGATYAAMFPDNVERLAIDGVVDFEDYYSGAWSQNLIDTDKILQFVYDKCAETDRCPLHANTSALVQQRLEGILASVKASPVPTVNGNDHGVVDFTMVKMALFQALYKPLTMIRPVIEALAALERGDGRKMLNIWRSRVEMPKCTHKPVANLREEAGTAVQCGDVASWETMTVKKITERFNNLSKVSVFADIWIGLTGTVCADWTVRQKERFSGSFSVNTSFPLLIIGNTADPVTPLAGARKAAREFEGSALLTVDIPGHCSLAGPTLCASKIVRNYFRDGKLPKQGTICEIEDDLFGNMPMVTQGMTAEDVELLEVAKSLGKDFHASRGSRPL